MSAILVVVADNSNPDHALLAMIPTFLFAALDAYYLAIERGFRNAYCRFVEKVHDGIVKPHDLYFVRPHGRTNTLQWEALRSFSVWGFYVVLAVLILAARSFVLT